MSIKPSSTALAPAERATETVELIEQEVAFQGYFRVGRYLFRHGLYQGGTSGPVRREVFERGHAAAVLPYDPQRDEVVLIRQFRAGAYVAGQHPWTWEVVAGMLQPGELPESLARREAVEEANLTLSDIWPMHDFVVSPGGCSETCVTLLGRTNTGDAGGIFGLIEEDENILVKVLPWAEARRMLDHGEIESAIGVIALQWLALHRDEVRRRWR